MTKVYRGQDYNSLVWCFGRLFDRVRAHKPPSSRAQSAEIFVVCTGYLAPHKVDPRLLDPKHVFMDINGETLQKPLAVLHPKAGKKRKASRRLCRQRHWTVGSTVDDGELSFYARRTPPKSSRSVRK